jgi:ribonuclease BN (tRNA processing enzyme)
MKYSKRVLSGNLSLINDGQLSLFPIGSGSAFTKKLYQNNLLVIKGDTHLLIDCGTRTPEAFAKLGLPITEVKNFLITHSHADHIGGLEEVILMGRYVARQKPNIIITKEFQKLLWNESLKDGGAMNEVHDGKPLEFLDYWTVHRPRAIATLGREAWHINFGKLRLTLFRTKHFPDSAPGWQESAFSTGCVIDDRILFTGDTRFDPEIIELVCKQYPIDLILHDVQFFPGGVHAPFDDLKTLPEDIRAKTLLMHYPDTWQTHEQKVAAAGFAGFVEQQTFYDFAK